MLDGCNKEKISGYVLNRLCNINFTKVHNFCLTILLFLIQASLDGLTGPLHFSEDGARTRIELDILNLRNYLFKKVSHKKHHKIICCCVLWQIFFLTNRAFSSIMPCILSLELYRTQYAGRKKKGS